MISPLSGSIAKTIHKAMRKIFLDAILTRDVPAMNSPDIDPFDPPAPNSVDYSCKAIGESFAETFMVHGVVKNQDRRILILANSLSVTPTVDDRITYGGITYVIIAVEVDAANAVWVCQGR